MIFGPIVALTLYTKSTITFSKAFALLLEITGKELLQVDQALENLQFNIAIVSFMSALIDTFGHNVLQDTPQIISFIKAILEWSQDTEKKKRDLTSGFYEQTLNMVLMLLSTLLPRGEVCSCSSFPLSELVRSKR